MTASTHEPREATVLLFGSQVESLSKQSLDDFRNTLLDSVSRKWILDTVAGLPSYWDAMSKSVSKITDAIGTRRGEQLLADLDSWLRRGPNGGQEDDLVPTPDALPSMVLSPLAVLAQIAQYRRYLEVNRIEKDGTNNTDLHADMVAQKKTSTLGFCLGLLGAFAVASASNKDELDRFGSVAVRLAMVSGALIDAQDEWNKKLGLGPSKWYATAWRNPQQREDMRRIVDGLFPEAYTSVLYDEARATITTSERAAPRLLRHLHGAGITTATVGYRGDIHSPKPETWTDTDALIAFCNTMPGLQFPDAARLALESYTNAGDGRPVAPDAGSMHEIALRAIFAQQCDWYGTFAAVQAARLVDSEALVVSFGIDRCVPPTLMRSLGSGLLHFADLHGDVLQPCSDTGIETEARPQQHEGDESTHADDEDAIAVIGMSIKVAGADDLDEFSRMLRTGESQHQPIGPDRMVFDSLFRDEEQPPRQWYGNLMRDIDAFDHKFFKKSPRESAAMDPQQRLLLQAAYQAVEQAGYFTETARGYSGKDGKDRAHVGVYVGAPAMDYENNVACHRTNAFTATGNLRSFLAGRVAHYFGWTGPAMTLDTACSSSTVAIHTACRNLLAGECHAALAGGVALLTNPLWFQNLAAANFLSPTGQCKPFDHQADGFCRAEGIACVFLKRMSDAVADGNPILGCIASSAVYQNGNSTPMFVPNVPSLSLLFKDVIRKANLAPSDISLVEAHGTGTAVGDPAEYEGIRIALGGPGIRPKPLPIGSLKGHIGHTEGASGVASLIKVLLMMRENYIPPQASFSKLNPAINASPSDLMEVVTSLRPWSDGDDRKVALINNYGAGGSNTAMVVAQSRHHGNGSAPIRGEYQNHVDEQQPGFPFRITGLDVRSIKAYAAKLASALRSRPESNVSVLLTLGDMSFNINRHSNPALGQSLIFSCRSVEELDAKLSFVASDETSPSFSRSDLEIEPTKPQRPVILCFGGQVSTFVGLDRKLYDSITVLRHHLDECDAIMQSEPLGLSSIYPAIFSHTPAEDPVRLQTMLFAMQYACARCWMDCGLSGKIVAVVGHSFGELTALCISGVLSLQDAIHLVARRARLVRDAWGPDRGAMMAVETDESLVQELLTEAGNHVDASHGPASIACYNGPRNFALAGSTKATDAVAETLASNDRFAAIKSKKLNVTNAFHSPLVDPLMDPLELVGSNLTFQEPSIPVERATETEFTGPLTRRFVSDHMRKPVFFSHAIQRLARKHPSAVFLEAGSSSTITAMASRALMGETAAGSSYHFQAINITNNKGLASLTDSTVSLWKQGLHVSFWGHHARQTNEYASLLLPPYQFEKTRHWLGLKSSTEAVEMAAARLLERSQSRQRRGELETDEKNLGLWTFVGYQDEEKGARGCTCRFRINTGSDKYNKLILGHVIAQTAPICPGTLQMDMAIEALFSLHPDWKEDGLQPVIQDMANHAPLCVDPSRVVWLDLKPLDSDQTQWEWHMSSAPADDGAQSQTQIHVHGRLHLRSPKDASYIAEFARFERLVSHSSCKELLDTAGRDGDEVQQGRNVYRTFTEFVDYAEMYRCVSAVVGRGDECAGRVHRRHSGDTWLDVLLDDCFSQVSGLWVNCMTDTSPDDMYIASGCEMSMRSPRGVLLPNQGHDVWHVYSRNTRQSDAAYVADVFVFNAASGELAEVMLGIQYTRVSKVSMRRMLTNLTQDKSMLVNACTTSAVNQTQDTANPAAGIVAAPSGVQAVCGGETDSISKRKKKQRNNKNKSSGRLDVADEVRRMVATIAGLEVDNVTLDTALADIGIDSLMGMELGREVDVVFKRTLPQAELLQAIWVHELVVLISSALFGATGESYDKIDSNDYSSDQDHGSNTSQGTSLPDTGSAAPDEKSVAQEDIECSASTALLLSSTDILECFGDVKMSTDKQLCDFHLDNIDRAIIAATSRLCVALIVEAFEELGCHLRAASSGATLERVPFLGQHERLMEWVYGFLETEARLVDVEPVTGQLTRTAVTVSPKSSEAILKELLEAHPDWAMASRLIFHAGKQLAGVLLGETDGIRVLFGSAESRELVAALYRDHPFNMMLAGQMRDLIGRLAEISQRGGTLKILEMGAGTGGTTCVLVPFLASMDIQVEYTFTDLSSSMVAAARRRFGKQYPFMRFAVHDIEKPPVEELYGQHIVIASNAVHATHSIAASAANMHKALRPDGFLMLLEQTECMPFSNLIFGLLESWWLFDDGRSHATVSAQHWERDLHAAGFGHVDWTDGHLPENNIQRVIVALASGPTRERLPIPESQPGDEQRQSTRDVATRQAKAERYVAEYTAGWAAPTDSSSPHSGNGTVNRHDAVVVVTGATGSLGSHLVAAFAEHPDVKTVVCVNRRRSSMPVEMRQADAFSRRGISLSPASRAKLRILETDTSLPQLGLAASEYDWLAQQGSHIVHNAWPMSSTRPIAAFEAQFQTMRNLLDLARDMACRASMANDSDQFRRIDFQLVTSIGVVGHAGQARVPEHRVSMAAVLPTGYCEAKWVCERMLDETLHKHPALFRPMVVRPGQIAGSTTSGVWNPVEHFAFMVKSAQSLRSWPDLDGTLQWVPVDYAAAAMVDLLHIGNEANAPQPSPVYHIDNPVGQPWKEMSPVLADALGIPPDGIVPFRDWLRRVCRSPLQETENPAARIVDFIDDNFERMSCGGFILDVSKAQEHSKTMAALGSVSSEVTKRYMKAWKQTGFLAL